MARGGGGCARGFADAVIAASSGSLIETLRLAVGAECDRLAEAEFMSLLDSGRIRFRLRADRHDFELTLEMSVSNLEGPRLGRHVEIAAQHVGAWLVDDDGKGARATDHGLC